MCARLRLPQSRSSPRAGHLRQRRPATMLMRARTATQWSTRQAPMRPRLWSQMRRRLCWTRWSSWSPRGALAHESSLAPPSLTGSPACDLCSSERRAVALTTLQRHLERRVCTAVLASRSVLPRPRLARRACSHSARRHAARKPLPTCCSHAASEERPWRSSGRAPVSATCACTLAPASRICSTRSGVACTRWPTRAATTWPVQRCVHACLQRRLCAAHFTSCTPHSCAFGAVPGAAHAGVGVLHLQ